MCGIESGWLGSLNDPIRFALHPTGFVICNQTVGQFSIRERNPASLHRAIVTIVTNYAHQSNAADWADIFRRVSWCGVDEVETGLGAGSFPSQMPLVLKSIGRAPTAHTIEDAAHGLH